MNQTPDNHTSQDNTDTFYAKHQKIYPRETRGLFSNLKTLSNFVLLGLFYFVPWLQWDEHQAILFSLPERKFYFFDIVFWPQDFIYLAFLLIIAALSLFFFTSLAGRLWCGFACPQTVWTDMFLWMERLVEGDRPQQIKLDKAPMSARKLGLKTTKHTLWVTFSLLTGFTFVGYFTPIRELYVSIQSFDLGGWEIFWLFFYGFATYGNAGWLREQICIYMCPYARFQSAMFDKDTMIIAYDQQRGEPRGSRKRGEDYKAKKLGECVNCTLCVQVCPTGIDIRNGLQYQCISCSACIDVCNEVMDKMNYPRGLVRYTTENRLNGIPTHILRPRIFIYGTILLALLLGLLYMISQRVPVLLDIIRDRNSLYRELNDGSIENIYTLKIMNMDKEAHDYKLTAIGIDAMKLEMDVETIHVNSGDVLSLPVRLIADPAHLSQMSSIVAFELDTIDQPTWTTTEEGRFLGPLPTTR